MKNLTLLSTVLFLTQALNAQGQLVADPVIVVTTPVTYVTDTSVINNPSSTVIYNPAGTDTYTQSMPMGYPTNPKFALKGADPVAPVPVQGTTYSMSTYIPSYGLIPLSGTQAMTGFTVGTRSDVRLIIGGSINIDKWAATSFKYSGGSYSRYGAWNVNYGTETVDCFNAPCTSSITTVAGDKGLFAGGLETPTSTVPRGGKATYTGNAVRNTLTPSATNTSASVPMTFAVNFGARSIVGTSGSSAAFGDSLKLNGLLLGNGFAGLARSGTAFGGFSGKFYGPAAQELAGTAQFSNTNLNAAFGGSK